MLMFGIEIGNELLQRRTAGLTALALLAFAGNSLLCRLALRTTPIDAATFTSIRLASGALVLWAIVRVQQGQTAVRGSWRSALALFVYAAAFSFAYVSLSAATGALLLFVAVQITMIGYGLWRGERLGAVQTLGALLALGGLVTLVLPGLAAPPLAGALLMIAAGMAWGVYSLRGRGARNPAAVTAGNFGRAVPFTLVLSVLAFAISGTARADAAGVGLALASGAITSGLGYVIWYAVLPRLQATQAAIVQLSVPVIAAIGGVLVLGEALTLRFVIAAATILSGIALVVLQRQPARS